MAAAASLYGVGIVTDKEDSPHLLLDKIKGELYYTFAETDHAGPEPHPRRAEKGARQGRRQTRAQGVPGHAARLLFPRAGGLRQLAAEKTWSKIFAMWDRTLK